MGERKEIEDYLFNHDEIKREKYLQTEELKTRNKWQQIYKKIQSGPLRKWVDK